MFSDNLNSSNAMALVFLRKQNIFFHRTISPLRQETLSIIAKQLHLGLINADISGKKLHSFMFFVAVFPCFLVYFSLF
jgi:hypothetical protein